MFTKKLIVILGPTASGKSEIAVKLAQKFNAEIISADSRQVYKEMDIGTGKVLRDKNSKFKIQNYFYKSIPHYLLDVASPRTKFTVTQYQKLALKAIDKIFKKKKLPILCGGTGFYIQAVVDGIIIPRVKPDWKLRVELEKQSTEELFTQLKKLDPHRAKTIESKNKRRLIRAVEIIMTTKKPVPAISKKPLPYSVLMVGINLPKQELEKRIEKRVKRMLKMGLEKEVKILVEKYGWGIPALQTIGYQEWKDYWKGNIKKRELIDLIVLRTKQFAKRQLTWFKRDPNIHWLSDCQKIEKIITDFLKQ
jgi:tRNA dimethylallyltransferase